MANIVDPDQTAPYWSSLNWVCTVCSDLCALMLRIFMVSCKVFFTMINQQHVHEKTFFSLLNLKEVVFCVDVP